MRLGSAHTLQLETGRAFTVIKDVWDSVTLERLKEATGEGAASTAELAAVLLQPGLATICVVSNGMSIVKARVETHIPRRGNAVQLQVRLLTVSRRVHLKERCHLRSAPLAAQRISLPLTAYRGTSAASSISNKFVVGTAITLFLPFTL